MASIAEKFSGWPILRKLFAVMLVISLLPVALVLSVSLKLTFNTMQEQLVYDSSMNVEWLQDRLEMEIEGYTRSFYELEIDSDFRSALSHWCAEGDLVDYAAKLEMINTLNQIVSVNSNINAIELYSFTQGRVLLAERFGSAFADTGDRLERWLERDEGLQSNVVLLRSEREILLCHQMHRFETGEAYALIVIRLRPYFIQDILDAIKSRPGEALFLFNDEGELIESDAGDADGYGEGEALKAAEVLSGELAGYLHENGCYWFYRSVSGGKLHIVQAMPDAAIRASLSGTLLSGIAVALVAAVLCVFFSAVFSQAIGKPIVSLAGTMRSATFEDKVDMPEQRHDEIGLLLQSFNYMQRQNQELVKKEYTSQLATRSAQLYALQSQINPHFLYNTLQLIGAMALRKRSPEIYAVTTDLGDILRYSLNFSDETVALREELRYFGSYLSMQKLRFGDKLRVSIDVPEALSGALVPKLILQPILENSFSHGFTEKGRGWDVAISVGRSGEKLIIAVADNGAGIPAAKLAELRERLARPVESSLRAGEHIGLSNVNLRIRLRDGGAPYGLSISSEPGRGTTVELIMKYVEGGGRDEPDGGDN